MSDSSLAAIERAMNRIRRSQTRRTLGKLATSEGCGQGGLSLVPLLDVMEEGAAAGGEEITIGFVAGRLGLDPSRASRMVTAAIAAGYVTRVASQADGRRTRLEFTPAGVVFANQAHSFRQAFFDRALAGWSERDRFDLARLLTRFTNDLANTAPC